MKLSFFGVLALALLTAAPAFAQHDDRGHSHGPMQQNHMQQRPQYHQGQVYHGHRLQNHNGHWGYYQPHGGSQVFISIPL